MSFKTSLRDFCNKIAMDGYKQPLQIKLSEQDFNRVLGDDVALVDSIIETTMDQKSINSIFIATNSGYVEIMK